jgi:hypothetical protein
MNIFHKIKNWFLIFMGLRKKKTSIEIYLESIKANEPIREQANQHTTSEYPAIFFEEQIKKDN